MTLFQTIILVATFSGVAVLEVQSQVQKKAAAPVIIATNGNPGSVTAKGSPSGAANGFRPTISGFSPGPVSGFAPNPVNGFNENPVGGFKANAVSGFNANPAGGSNSNLIQGFAADPVTGLNENPANGLTPLDGPQPITKSSVIVTGGTPVIVQTNSGSTAVTNTNAVPPRF